MEYVGIGLLGVLFGSLVNIYTEFSKRTQPLYRWGIIICFTKLKHFTIVLIMSLACLLLFREYGFSLNFLKFTVLTAILIAASLKDIASKIIPNRLVLSGIIAGIVLLSVNGLKEAVAGAVFGLVPAVLLLLISWLAKGGVGMGDVKLTACVGIFIGPGRTLSALVISVVLSGLTVIGLLLAKKIDRKGTIPFAPFIFIGTFINLIFY